MESKISKAFSNIHWEKVFTKEIHVADYSTQTCSKRGVEIHEYKPCMGSLMLSNPTPLAITFSVFGEQSIIDKSTKKELSHCECVTFPTANNINSWVLFIELKHCESKNISKYFDYAKEQIKKTVQEFRNRKIIAEDKKVYAVISFPNRNKVDFYNQLIQQEERKEFFDKYRIIIKGTNRLTVKDEKHLI
jgi:disulfide oxidoreductase YuzD